MLIESSIDYIFHVWHVVSMTSIVCILFNMGININNKILIENLQKHKRWSLRKLLKEFPSKYCSRSGLYRLLKRIDSRGNADRAVGSGRPRSARTLANIAKVEELVCSQESERQAWRPNSPDINLVDYAVLGAFQQRVYFWRKFESVDELKRALTLEWGRLSQNFINQSIAECVGGTLSLTQSITIAEWRQRLQNNGAHIEHLFK